MNPYLLGGVALGGFALGVVVVLAFDSEAPNILWLGAAGLAGFALYKHYA